MLASDVAPRAAAPVRNAFNSFRNELSYRHESSETRPGDTLRNSMPIRPRTPRGVPGIQGIAYGVCGIADTRDLRGNR